MKKLAATLLMGSLLALGACGGAKAGGPPTITMGAADFVGTTNITINKGQTVTFNDPSDSGGTHFLVTGTNGQYKPETGAPSDFESSTGLKFSPGSKVVETFNTAGTYDITCTVHQSMQATITVK